MTDNDMTDLRKAAEMALEFVSSDRWGTVPYMDGAVFFDAIELQNALRAALAQPSIKDTRDEEIALLREEIKRLRFCIPEGDAAAAMEYLAYCVDKAVAAEREALKQQKEIVQCMCGLCKLERP